MEWDDSNLPMLPPYQHQPPQAPPAPRKRTRAALACQRCQRLRTKCIHTNAETPCERCRRAGIEAAAACAFIIRSHRDTDRGLPRPSSRNYAPVQNDKSPPPNMLENSNHENVLQESSRSSSQPEHAHTQTNSSLAGSQDSWDLLPPFDEVMEGCRAFSTACFQIGFIPKALFLERLTKDKSSTSVFLLLSILSISSPHTPSLYRRYGDSLKATKHFIDSASSLIANEIYEPNIERIQGFFLLGVSEWAQGNGTRSAMHLGIAVRMASILHMHREESYTLPDNATVEDIIDSESRRRTFWLLECQEHLYAEYNGVVPFALQEITTLLPSNEDSYAFGIAPSQRSALVGSQAAIKNPGLVFSPSASLFATVVQAHNLWGQIARRAGRAPNRNEAGKNGELLSEPWEKNSEYLQLTRTLKTWEHSMPTQHRWSEWNFRGYKSKFLGRAYLSEVIVTRLSNIVIRRIYLDEILKSVSGTSSNVCPLPDFWTAMSHELFANVCSMHDIVNTYYTLRVDNEGTPAILVFCVYICGSLASHLLKCPQLCPQLASSAENIVTRSIETLQGLLPHWPIASRWLDALRHVSCPTEADNRGLGILEQNDIDNGPFISLGMENISCFSVGASGGPGTMNSNYGIEQFLEGSSHMDFNVGFNLEGETIQVL